MIEVPVPVFIVMATFAWIGLFEVVVGTIEHIARRRGR